MTQLSDEQLIVDLQTESDLCRNETANDIADLLDRAIAALQSQPAEPVKVGEVSVPRPKRADYFQKGFVGSGPDCPMIIHFAGDDVTSVASFSREEDRDYVLALIAAHSSGGA